MWSDWALEKQAAKLYNRGIFYKFQQELMNSTKFHMMEMEKKYEVYKSPTQALFDYNPRTFIVVVDTHSETISCVCGKFEKDGILCCHALKVIQALNIDELPEKYFIDRWRPKEKRAFQANEEDANLEDLDEQMAFFSFSRRLVQLASEASKNPARRKVLNKQIGNLERLILDIPCMPELEQSKCSASDLSAVTGGLLTSDSKGENTINDPIYSKPKGRMKKTGRQKSILEEIISRPKVTCSGCNKQGHNITGCKQIQQESPAKPKKSASRKNAKQHREKTAKQK